MPVQTQANALGDVLKYEEATGRYSRALETVAAGQKLAIGTVMARKGSDRKLYALNPAAGDGTETAIGVLIVEADATLIDTPALLAARHAIVAAATLIWPAGITPEQKTLAIDQLEARGILVRASA